MKPPSINALRIVLGRDGYYIADEDGEVVDPGTWRTWVAAAARLDELIADDIEAKRQELEDADDHE